MSDPYEEASPPRQKSAGGLSAASPAHSAESTDEPFAVRRTRMRVVMKASHPGGKGLIGLKHAADIG